MTRLEAVNTILRALGETPLPSLDVQYPTLSLVLPALDAATDRLLHDGWWFNTLTEIELHPGTDGSIHLPTGVLTFYPEDNEIVYTGTQLVSVKTGAVVKGPGSVKGRMVLLKEFEQLPITAQYAVTYSAAVDAYVADHGEDSISARIRENYIDHRMELGNQHTRSRGLSIRKSRRWARYVQQLRA